MRLLRWTLIFALIAIAAWRLWPHLSDFSKVIHLKDEARPGFFALAVFFQAGQYLGDGWLSQLLLKIIGVKVSFKETLKIASLNVFAANVLPIGEAGSLAATFYFYRKLGVSVQQIIFLSVSWSAATAGVLLAMFASSIAFLPKLPNIPIKPIQVISILIVIALILVDLFLLEKKLFINLFKKFIVKFFSRYGWYKEILKFKKDLPLYVKDLFKSKILLAQVLIAAAIYYVSNIATLTASFLTFGHFPNLAVVTVAYTLSLLLGWATLAPAGIGTAEATLILVFLHYDTDPVLTLAAVLVFRLLNFWLPIPTGLLSYLSLKRDMASAKNIK